MISELYTGTHAVSGTEWSLTTDTSGPDADTTDGVFQAFLDLSDMIAGDQIQIRIYEKCRSGDSQVKIFETFLSGAQSNPMWVSPSLILLNGWDVTVIALSGTVTVLWSIRQVA